MKQWLIDNGVSTQIFILQIFDYISEMDAICEKNEKINDILFAGNLIKSSFLTKLYINTKFSLFGINPSESYPDNVSYKGAFSSKELESKMNGKFGLVWDGDSPHTCSGISGNYMRYNNPHKTSLYLSLGIPVIIWREAALSNFILENKIGIVVDDLLKLDDVLMNISEEEYRELKKNAINMSHKIKEGYYTKRIASQIIKDISE